MTDTGAAYVFTRSAGTWTQEAKLLASDKAASNYYGFCVALSGDGRLLASGCWDRAVRLWRVPGGQPMATLQGHADLVYGVALSGDGRLLASGGDDGTVRLWEAGSGQLLATLQGHTGAVWAVALSGDGRLLASGGVDGTVRLWEAGSGQRSWHWAHSTGR